VLGDQQGHNSKHTMVNKTQKTEGLVSKAKTAAPKPRVATKAKPAGRVTAAAPVAKTAKPAKAKAPKRPALSPDDVALRAYFIAEKRQQLGLPGDSMSDWVQAEAELISERRTSGLN
jgi:hypothetical protein